MLISARAVRMLVEASERSGIDTARILTALDLNGGRLANDDNSIPWSLFVRLNAEVSAAVGNDPDRLREIGRNMTGVPAYAPIRGIARTVVSASVLYDLAYRWFGRSNFPHLRLLQRIDGDHLTLHGFI